MAKKATIPKEAQKQVALAILREADRCFDETAGMQIYSTQESDEYWDFAQKAMMIVGKARGFKKLPRRDRGL
jgi:hypothetical protein